MKLSARLPAWSILAPLVSWLILLGALTGHRPSLAGLFEGLAVAGLGSVVLLAKTLSPTLEAVVAGMGALKALVGIIIAVVVLLPESIAAYQAARANRLQTSLNLALGSA